MQRFFKGVFNLRPPKTAKTSTWDVNTLLLHIKNMPINSNLFFKDLTHKLVALLMLLASSRVHYIHSFSIGAMAMTKDTCTFYPTVLLKHSRPSFPGEPITYQKFPDDEQLCILSCLREYLDRRYELVQMQEITDKLLITHRKPHHAAHKDTVARWLKEILKDAGIDTTRFTAHTYRAASSSFLHEQQLPIDEILKRGQWTQKSTFLKYYRKDIEHDIHFYTGDDAPDNSNE